MDNQPRETDTIFLYDQAVKDLANNWEHIIDQINDNDYKIVAKSYSNSQNIQEELMTSGKRYAIIWSNKSDDCQAPCPFPLVVISDEFTNGLDYSIYGIVHHFLEKLEKIGKECEPVGSCPGTLKVCCLPV